VHVSSTLLSSAEGRVNVVAAGPNTQVAFDPQSRRGTITVTGSGRFSDVTLDASEAAPNSRTELSASQGGNVFVRGRNLRVTDGAMVQVNTSRAAGGTIDVGLTGTMSVDGGASLQANTSGAGAGGSIRLRADQIVLRDVPEGVDNTRAGVVSANIELANVPDTGTGAGGRISLDARRIDIAHGAQVAAFNAGSGAGGSVSLRATKSITIDGADSSNRPAYPPKRSRVRPGAAGRFRSRHR
jgi:hypothetical protein